MNGKARLNNTIYNLILRVAKVCLKGRLATLFQIHNTSSNYIAQGTPKSSLTQSGLSKALHPVTNSVHISLDLYYRTKGIMFRDIGLSANHCLSRVEIYKTLCAQKAEKLSRSLAFEAQSGGC